MHPILYTLFIGALSGWLAGLIRQGYGYGLLGNIVIGIIGAYLGSWLFRQIGISPIGGPTLSHIITSVVGALVLLFLIGLVRKTK